MVGGRRHLELRGLEECLVPLIDELRYAPAYQVTGISKDLGGAVWSLFDGGRDVVLLEEDTIAGGRRLEDIESMIAKPGTGVRVRSCFDLLCHSLPACWRAKPVLFLDTAPAASDNGGGQCGCPAAETERLNVAH